MSQRITPLILPSSRAAERRLPGTVDLMHPGEHAPYGGSGGPAAALLPRCLDVARIVRCCRSQVIGDSFHRFARLNILYVDPARGCAHGREPAHVERLTVERDAITDAKASHLDADSASPSEPRETDGHCGSSAPPDRR